MNKALLIFLGVFSAVVVVSGLEVGYGLLINHVPWWGLKYGGLGVGQSIRYDRRLYPGLGMPWIAKTPVVPPPVKPILPPYGIYKAPVF